MNRHKVQCVHDSNIRLRNQGSAFLNCGRCLEEKPDGVSPSEWARLNVSITKTGGIQVWCVRHNVNVDRMTFKVKAVTQ